MMIGAAIIPMLCMWIRTLPIVIDRNWIIDWIIDCTIDFRTGLIQVINIVSYRVNYIGLVSLIRSGFTAC